MQAETLLEVIQKHAEVGASGYRVQEEDGRVKIVGHRDGGGHSVISVRFTRSDNAHRYRGWLTLSSRDVHALFGVPRHADYTLWYLMVGRLPDEESPWWSVAYPAELLRDHPDVLEGMDGDRWYRVDPTQLSAEARPRVVDHVAPSLWDVAPAAENSLTGALLEYETALPKVANDILIAVDEVMRRIRRTARSEAERRGVRLK